MRSPKSVLKQSTPCSTSARSFAWYQAVASGLVKSTSPMPACHRSHCQTVPSGFITRYPASAASSNNFDACPMYGLIQTQTRRSLSCRRPSMPVGSGNTRGSHSKSHQVNSRIQKQSKWNTDTGNWRAAISSTNEVTVASS